MSLGSGRSSASSCPLRFRVSGGSTARKVRSFARSRASAAIRSRRLTPDLTTLRESRRSAAIDTRRVGESCSSALSTI